MQVRPIVTMTLAKIREPVYAGTWCVYKGLCQWSCRRSTWCCVWLPPHSHSLPTAAGQPRKTAEIQKVRQIRVHEMFQRNKQHPTQSSSHERLGWSLLGAIIQRHKLELYSEMWITNSTNKVTTRLNRHLPANCGRVH